MAGRGGGAEAGGAGSSGGSTPPWPWKAAAAALWWPALSLAAFLVDSATDIILVIDYWRKDYLYWSLGTFLLILIPTILIQLFSIRWFIMDETASIWHWISHICLLGIVHRYTVIIKTGFKVLESKSQNDLKRLYLQQSDICMLHLFESFLEAVPQLLLQLYIMITLRDWHIFTGISATASLCSLSWAIVNYLRVLRRVRPEKACVRIPAIVLQVTWRGSLLLARISALLLFAVGFQNWIFVLLGVHWLTMTIWVIQQKTDFCPSRPEEIFYNCIVGVIYCFCFFNLKEGQARYRMLVFYVIMISQNIACIFLFMFLSEPEVLKSELIFIAIGLIIGGTIIGISSMLIFYRWFHPIGPIKCIEKKKVINPIDMEYQIETHQNITSQSKPDLPDESKNYSLRSLKQPWLENSNIPMKNEGISLEGSPQSEAECTDKKLLLEHWIARAGSPTFASAPIDKIDMIDTTGVEFYSVVNTPEKLNKSNVEKIGIANTSFQFENEPGEKLKVDSTRDVSAKIYLKNKRRGICSPTELRVDISASGKEKSNSKSANDVDMTSQKRRAICSSSQLEEDIDNDHLKSEARGENNSVSDNLENHSSSNEKTSSGSINLDLDLSFSDINSSDINEFNENIVQKLCLSTLKNIKNVHQDADIQNIQRIALEILKDLYNKGSKDDQDIESELSSSVGRDLDTPSEVLSTHDYENICAVNIAREAWGLRSWRACADMGASPPPPPLPARRHPPINTDRNQYINTIAYELARCEESNCELRESLAYGKESDSVFVAKPYVIDQNGGMFPLTTPLEPILEEIDEFIDINNSFKKRQRRCSESALVATIDEIRHDTVTNSPRNVYHRVDWDSPHLNVIKDNAYRNEQSKVSRQNLKKELWKDQLVDHKNKMNMCLPKKIVEEQPQYVPSISVPFSYKDPILRSTDSILLNNTNISKDITKSKGIHSLNTKNIQFKHSKNNNTVHFSETIKTSIPLTKVQNPRKENSKSKPIIEKNQEHNLSYEEIMFLSQLVNDNNSILSKKHNNHSSSEDISNLHISSSLQLLIDQDVHNNGSRTLDGRSSCKKSGSKPRRKFSLLREKFEPKSKQSDKEMLFQSLESVKSISQNNLEINSSQNLIKCSPNIIVVNQDSKITNDKENLTPLDKIDNQTEPVLPTSETVVLSLTPCEVPQSISNTNLKEKRTMFLKQVLSPPKINNWSKKS